MAPNRDMNAQGSQFVNTASTAASYHVADWREQFEAYRTGLVKQFTYSAMWTLLNMEAWRFLNDATLRASLFSRPVSDSEAHSRHPSEGTNLERVFIHCSRTI